MTAGINFLDLLFNRTFLFNLNRTYERTFQEIVNSMHLFGNVRFDEC